MADNVEFFKAETLQQALDLLNCGKQVRIVAGGTDYVVHQREHALEDEGGYTILDVTGIPELHVLKETAEGFIEIGAAVSHDEIDASNLIKEKALCLSLASASVGSPQIRNTGTIGGNVSNASLAADTLSALTALNAVAVICSAKGIREVPVKDIMVKPGKNCLDVNELIVLFRFKILEGYKSAFIKLGRRKALAISRMNVSACAKIENGIVTGISIAPGCVFSKPEHALKAETYILGKEPSEELAVEAGKLVSQEMIEKTGIRWSTEYKQPVIEILTERALKSLFEIN